MLNVSEDSQYHKHTPHFEQYCYSGHQVKKLTSGIECIKKGWWQGVGGRVTWKFHVSFTFTLKVGGERKKSNKEDEVLPQPGSLAYIFCCSSQTCFYQHRLSFSFGNFWRRLRRWIKPDAPSARLALPFLVTITTAREREGLEEAKGKWDVLIDPFMHIHECYKFLSAHFCPASHND